jgi:hypothetical protein
MIHSLRNLSVLIFSAVGKILYYQLRCNSETFPTAEPGMGRCFAKSCLLKFGNLQYHHNIIIYFAIAAEDHFVRDA